MLARPAPQDALTMGIGTILAAKKIVLAATGKAKAKVLAQALEGKITDRVTASFLQRHKNVLVVVDQAAGSKLSRS